MNLAHAASLDAAPVLSKAVLRAANLLGLSQKDLSRALGTSPASLSRLVQGRRALDPSSKQGELALLLVRVFRSADALLGGNERDLRAWFHAPNVHLRGIPAERVQTVEGLVEVAAYLDALRGKL
jgi:Antitoxin Xre/MbcA/ParS C-terminal toxin-binding domain/Antitoxin Xre-like helix-turn-helix domain